MIDPQRPLSDSERARTAQGTRLPTPLPGWRFERVGPFMVLVRDYANGLRALYSIDPYASWSDCEDGWWRHLSISRQNKYPTWEEQRDLVYGCGYFDTTRNVRMVLPARREYIGELGTGPRHVGKDTNPNVFHWWQLE